MKVFASIENGIVVGMSKHADSDSPHENCIDVTGLRCMIGWPIGNNKKPVEKPSKYHTLLSDNTGWELTDENEIRKMDTDAESARMSDIAKKRREARLKSITVEQAEKWIDVQIDPATDIDELKQACKKVLKEIVIFII